MIREEPLLLNIKATGACTMSLAILRSPLPRRLAAQSSRNFGAQKIPSQTGRFSLQTLQFISRAQSLNSHLRKMLISSARDYLAEYNEKSAAAQKDLLLSKEKNISLKEVRICDLEHAGIPAESMSWHANRGEPSGDFGENTACDIDQIRDLLSTLPKNTLVIEDRGTFNGQNLLAMLLKASEDRPVIGVGSDINLPNIKIGQMMCRYLGIEDIARIGYGSAHEISGLIPSVTKVITMINLLSVMSC